MQRFWLIPAVFFLAVPFYAHAQQIEQMPENSMQQQDPDAVAPSEGMPSDDAEPPVKEVMPKPVKAPKEPPVKEQKLPEPLKPTESGDMGFNTVEMRVLNKVTARTEEIDAPIGSVVRSGTIEIVAHSCWKSAPEDRPENAALLEISEVKQGEAPTQIFLGWMFSSSPGLSALEHPFYDVTIVQCKKDKEEPKAKEPK